MPVIGGVDLGNLTDYLFLFTNGSVDANWQGASKGFVGDVAVNGLVADLRTSGFVPYAGTIFTNAAKEGAWQATIDDNPGQAFGSTGQVALVNGLQGDLASAFAQIDALAANVATVTGSGDGQTVTASNPANYFGAVPGAAIDVVKYVSVNSGITWIHAPTPPGPVLPFLQHPRFQYVVTNVGTVTLTGVSLVDSVLGPITLPTTTLAPGQSVTVFASGAYTIAERENTATASGTGDGVTVTASDPAYLSSVFPAPPTTPQVVGGLLASIALEEAAIAHLVSAEAEKAQRIAGTLPTPSLFARASDMQKTILATMGTAALKELIALDQVRRDVSVTF